MSIHNIIPSAFLKSSLIFNKDMNSVQSRVASFTNWPTGNRQTPKDLAAAGFYYYGSGDKCVCFYCGIGIHKWLPEDNPWFEHALHSGKCTFLHLNKSQLKLEFVQQHDTKSRVKDLVCLLL
jgi:baculoviral IAP repeat-containing protein 7/8